MSRKLGFRFMAILAIVMLLAASGCGRQAEAPQPQKEAKAPVELTFYYPVAVGGPITKLIEGMANDFMRANPDIKVKPVFAGNYSDTLTKVQTAIQGGQSPEVAVLLSTDLYTLVDQDFVVPLDGFIQKDTDGQAYLKDFYPAFMANSQAGGKTWGMPFQRSTVVLYWNKDLFKAAGLDPDKPPKTWDELVADGKRLTKPDGSVWGLKIPSDGYPYWLLQGFAMQAGKNICDDTGTKVFFNSPENIRGLEFFLSLSRDDKIMPTGVIQWAAVPTDFVGGKAAMIFHTTGSLTNIAQNAKFPFGVAFLPAGPKGYGTPTGGGNFYIFKQVSPEKQQAAWKFVRWMTHPENLAKWSIGTGYVAPRQSSYDTPVMKDFVAKNPNFLVARDQLQYAQRELSTHRNPEIYKAYNTKLQDIVTGKLGVKEAIDAAQKEAEQILSGAKSSSGY